MKEYKIHVSMPSTRFNETIFADEHNFSKGRLNFLVKSDKKKYEYELYASYPSRYTVIEKIIKNADKRV
jgi:hypothetical protein